MALKAQVTEEDFPEELAKYIKKTTNGLKQLYENHETYLLSTKLKLELLILSVYFDAYFTSNVDKFSQFGYIIFLSDGAAAVSVYKENLVNQRVNCALLYAVK